MDIKDIYPGCTYHYEAHESCDFIIDTATFYSLFEEIISVDDFSPIPITTKLLEQLGFIYLESIGNIFLRLEGTKFQVKLLGTHFILGVKPAKTDFFGITPIVYLHDIQLAFKLIGVDLYLGTEKNYGNQA